MGSPPHRLRKLGHRREHATGCRMCRQARRLRCGRPECTVRRRLSRDTARPATDARPGSAVPPGRGVWGSSYEPERGAQDGEIHYIRARVSRVGRVVWRTRVRDRRFGVYD